MIRAIIFDCFGVLYRDSRLVFMEQYVSDTQKAHDKMIDLEKAYDYGYISAEAQAEEIATFTGLTADAVFKKLRGPSERNDMLIAYMAELKASYKIGLLSNIGAGGMGGIFSKNEQTTLFDCVVLSGDVGMTKPGQEIFIYTAKKLGVEPDQCLMIDDRQENVDGAQMAGMQAVLFTDNHVLMQTFEKLL